MTEEEKVSHGLRRVLSYLELAAAEARQGVVQAAFARNTELVGRWQTVLDSTRRVAVAVDELAAALQETVEVKPILRRRA